MSKAPSETVVLVLKDVVYRHLEFRSLEDFLVDKYGFSKAEEKEHKISELKHIVSAAKNLRVKATLEENEKKLSSLKIYEGNYLESKICMYILGEITQKEEMIIGADKEGQYPVYTVKYQMIKFISESGYAIQQLIERLTVDLGIKIKSKEWVFHRCREG